MRIVESMLEIWQWEGKQHLIPVQGYSMFPLVRDGDQVLITHGYYMVHPGDIVVFRQAGKLFAHRVIRIYNAGGKVGFLTKGDNSTACDSMLSSNDIIGRAVAIKRGNKQISCNTLLWRVTSRVIVSCTLLWLKVYALVIVHPPLNPLPGGDFLHSSLGKGDFNVQYPTQKGNKLSLGGTDKLVCPCLMCRIFTHVCCRGMHRVFLLCRKFMALVLC